MDVPTEYYVQAALNFHQQSTYGSYPEPTPADLQRDGEAFEQDAGTQVTLASPQPGDAEHLDRILRGRRSRRVRASRLERDTLTGALCSAMAPSADSGLRPYPSAGGCYAVSAYCYASDVEGLDPGAYRFAPVEGTLVPLEAVHVDGSTVGEIPELLRTTVLRADTVQAVLILVADMHGIGSRYGERGYRYALLEAGHVSQNLALAFEARAISHCPLGGFFDDVVRRVFALPDQLHLPLYAMALA
ncbi:SagB/ThcOx family dehydrogenase [Streptomyces sp. NPDC006235]|uniref:SagB/ThcOx family dehydrogenase n=1 Tax=Streptomyces sp. NPDC006235 TaxID=3156736 RepID=UPI0033AA7314